MFEHTFKPSNDLTFKTVPPISDLLHKLFHDDKITNIQLDLHDVSHCDSAGLALLIEAQRLCKQYNKTLIMQGIPKAIYSLAEFCGVETLLEQQKGELEE